MEDRLSINFDFPSHDADARLRCADPDCRNRENTHVIEAVKVTKGPLGGDCDYEAEWVRGGVLAVRYSCEGCEKVSRFEFGQHKGETFIRTIVELEKAEPIATAITT